MPCAALLTAGERGGKSEYAARVIAEHCNGLLRCGVAKPAAEVD